MPLYEFRCNRCGKIVEKRQPVADVPPVCCGCKTERVFSTVNLSFGWRLTEKSHERFSKDEWEKDV